MKKIIFLLLLSQLVWVTGCRKDLIDYFAGAHGNKKYTVNFRIGGLNHNIGEPNVGYQTEPLQNYIKYLSIIVYDVKTGAEVARQIQKDTDVNFGQIAFSLPANNYHFVAAGSNTLFRINRFYELPETPPLQLPYAEAYMQWAYEDPSEGEKRYRTTDTFIANATSNITANQTLDMIMQRQIGKVEVTFNDTPQFRVELHQEATAITFASKTTMHGVVFRPQFQVNTGINGPFRLDILASGGNIWLEVTPPGRLPIDVFVPIQKNKTTKVTGNIYTNELQFSFQ